MCVMRLMNQWVWCSHICCCGSVLFQLFLLIYSCLDASIELGGDPLPAPFDDQDDVNASLTERKQHQWPKGELNHHPLKMHDALYAACTVSIIFSI